MIYDLLLKKLSEYNLLLRIDPQDARLYYLRGDVLFDLSRFEEALYDFTRAVELDATFADAHYVRGLINDQLGNIDAALEDYSNATQANPEHVSAHNNRGGLYVKKKMDMQAFQDFSRALELDPDHPRAHYNRGSIYGKWGDYASALADFDRAIELQPAYVHPRVYRSQVHSILKNYSQALEDIQLALQLAPDNAEAIFKRGNIHEEMEEYRSAAADYLRTIELDPAYGEAYFRLGVLAVVYMDELAIAREMLERALFYGFTPAIEVLNNLASMTEKAEGIEQDKKQNNQNMESLLQLGQRISYKFGEPFIDLGTEYNDKVSQWMEAFFRTTTRDEMMDTVRNLALNEEEVIHWLTFVKFGFERSPQIHNMYRSRAEWLQECVSKLYVEKEV